MTHFPVNVSFRVLDESDKNGALEPFEDRSMNSVPAVGDALELPAGHFEVVARAWAPQENRCTLWMRAVREWDFAGRRG